MAHRAIGKPSHPRPSSTVSDSHHQLPRTHFHATRFHLVHLCLLGVGCGSGSPTLRMFPTDLANAGSSACDSPQSLETRAGGRSTTRLANHYAASGASGLPARATRPVLQASLLLKQHTRGAAWLRQAGTAAPSCICP